jgi:rubrerythrin
VGQVGVQVEESAVPAGRAPVAGEFRCAECGYGVVVQRVLPQCPMCGGTAWESRGTLGSMRVAD